MVTYPTQSLCLVSLIVLWLLISVIANAGSFLNVSYNGPLTEPDVRVGFIVDQAASLVFTAESVAGSGGTGIPDPTLAVVDVNSGARFFFNDDCDADVQFYLGRPLATVKDACAVLWLDPGAYAVSVRDKTDVRGNVLISAIESLRDIASSGGQATLTWDASPSPNVGGYRLYYGPASQDYSSSLDVGKLTNYTVIGLILGARYFFAVTAYDHTRTLESNFSNEVSTTARSYQ